MDVAKYGEAGLHGWKGAVGRRLSGPVSRRTPLTVEQARALFGALAFFFSLRYVLKTVAALTRR